MERSILKEGGRKQKNGDPCTHEFSLKMLRALVFAIVLPRKTFLFICPKGDSRKWVQKTHTESLHDAGVLVTVCAPNDETVRWFRYVVVSVQSVS